MTATTGSPTGWSLPYQLWRGKVPVTEQQRREAMVETIVAEFIDTDDESVFEQLAVLRPDVTHSVRWELVDALCHLSGEAGFWECQSRAVEAFELAVDEYRVVLSRFAGLPLHAVVTA